MTHGWISRASFSLRAGVYDPDGTRREEAAFTAWSMSSWTRSLLMAMAAADPWPAAVMTWARGSAALPAAQTPRTPVRPVRSVVGNPASSISQPRFVSGSLVEVA